MKKVHAGQVTTGDASDAGAWRSERVQAALGELVGAAREGLLALSVGVGLGVMHELMAEEVEEVCGPRGKHDPERVAYRHGSDEGEVTLGCRRVGVRVRGCAPRTTAARCRSRPTSTSPPVTC